jgi:hypothetical protein
MLGVVVIPVGTKNRASIWPMFGLPVAIMATARRVVACVRLATMQLAEAPPMYGHNSALRDWP